MMTARAMRECLATVRGHHDMNLMVVGSPQKTIALCRLLSVWGPGRQSAPISNQVSSVLWWYSV